LFSFVVLSIFFITIKKLGIPFGRKATPQFMLKTLQKIFGIGSLVLGVSFASLTTGLLIQGGKDQSDDAALQSVSISHNPSSVDGAVDLSLNPGVPDEVSLTVSNVMLTDGCKLSLAYVLPANLPSMASYLKVELSDGTQSFYSGSLSDAGSSPLISDYVLESGDSVSFAFVYTLLQSYPDGGGSFDFQLHVESHALVYGH
jgi:hypothetical protein